MLFTPETPTIVICSFGRSKLLFNTLSSLFENTGDLDSYRLIVVDNGSRRETLNVLYGFQDKIDELILLGRNAGKPYSWNLGISTVYTLDAIEGDSLPDYFVLCDSDIEFTPGWLTKMLHIYKLFEDLPLGVLSGYLTNVGEFKRERFEREGIKIDVRRHPPGCCWLVRRSVIEKVGLFSTNIKIRGVDTVYTRACWHNGYMNACVYPESLVDHTGHEQRTWDLVTGFPTLFD